MSQPPQEAASIDERIDRSLDPVARHRAGQHFTRPDVADLIAALCIRSARDSVLDPACGLGVLLRSARARQDRLGGRRAKSARGRLLGVESDADLVAAARSTTPGATIVEDDFLSMRASTIAALPERGTVDVVVGNPPYVRQELLGRAIKGRCPEDGPVTPGRADLHVHFWPEAIRWLRPGGRLGFLTSASWLDAVYGGPLRAWLADTVTVVAVVESSVESWFDRARIRTVLTVLEKRRGARGETVFVTLPEPLATSLPSRTPRGRLDAMDRLARRIETLDAVGRPPLHGRRVPRESLRAGRWGPSLRLPRLVLDLVERLDDRLVPLSRLASIAWGLKTGNDKLFILPRDARDVEEKFLAPVIFSQMELERIRVEPGDLSRAILLVDRRRGSIRGTRLEAYLRAAEKRGVHERPTCAARQRDGVPGRRWYELRPAPAAPILWSIMQQYRHLVAWNVRALPVNDNLLQVTPRAGTDQGLLLALLNANLTALLKQAHGRRRNEGMLKMQAVDLRDLPVPDPALIGAGSARRILEVFRPMCRRRIRPIHEECVRDDRRRLDREILTAVGMPLAEAERTAEAIAMCLVRIHTDERRLERDAVTRRRRRPARAEISG